MRVPLSIHALAVIITAFAALPGCAVQLGYGRVSPAPEDKTIQELVDNRHDFHVYYSGLHTGRPSGLMFDPRHDDRELTGKLWEPVTDRATLDEIVMWLGFHDHYKPGIFEITGPEKVLYGYVYTGWNHIVARSVDAHTMYVMGLPAPLPDHVKVPPR
jgi:hypothetical protein